MEVNSSLYNLEYISDSMEQKDRGSHCCTGEWDYVLSIAVSFSPFRCILPWKMFPFTTSRIITSDPNEKKKSSMYPVEFFEYRHSTIKMRSRVYWTSWLIKRFLSDSVWNLIRDSYKFKTFLTQWYYLISVFLCIFKAILNEGSQSIMSFI